MSNRKTVILFIIVFAFLYLFFFPPFLGKELVFNPVWIKDLTSMKLGRSSFELPVENDDAGRIIPFTSDHLFGYLSTAGEVLYLDRALYHTTVSQERFVNSSNVPSNLVVRDREGSIDYSIDTNGYAVFAENRLFVFSPNRNSIAEYDDRGALRWRRELLAPITCIDFTENTCIIGNLSGEVMVFNIDGEKVFSFTPTGSKIEVIYGCTMTRDEQFVAVIAGLHPQRFIVLEHRGDSYKPIYTEILETELRREAAMHISDSGDIVYFEGGKHPRVFFNGEKFSEPINSAGRLIAVSENKEYMLHFLTLEHNDGCRIAVFDPQKRKLVTDFHIDSSDVFLNVSKNSLFLGFQKKVVRLDMQVR